MDLFIQFAFCFILPRFSVLSLKDFWRVDGFITIFSITSQCQWAHGILIHLEGDFEGNEILFMSIHHIPNTIKMEHMSMIKRKIKDDFKAICLGSRKLPKRKQRDLRRKWVLERQIINSATLADTSWHNVQRLTYYRQEVWCWVKNNSVSTTEFVFCFFINKMKELEENENYLVLSF